MLKEKIKKIIPDSKLKILQRLHYTLYLLLHRQGYRLDQKKSWGKENPDKTYYIYRFSNDEVGILVFNKYVLTKLKTIIDKGYIPIIDYERGKNFISNQIGKDNLWDYYFEQPCGVGINDIKNSKNIILGGLFHVEEAEQLRIKTQNFKQYYAYWEQKAKEYTPIKSELQKKWTNDFHNLFGQERILGVCLREDFRMLHEHNMSWAKRHPEEPPIEEIIKVIKEYKQKWRCNKIYVTTMFQESLDCFCNEFPDEVLYINRSRRIMDKNYIKAINEYQILNEKNKNELYDFKKKKIKEGSLDSEKSIMLPYLQEMFGLSMCNCLLGTKCGGMRMALVWNGGKYENVDVFQKEKNEIFY